MGAVMKEKISIIVPVYNVEKYIDTCIQSLRMQTYENLEIILIDDGSADSSGLICDNHAGEDHRIKVKHIPNSGQSHARNVGLGMTTGSYIGFVDGDDSVEPHMYETLFQLIKERDAFIAECNFIGRKSEEKDDMTKGQVVCETGRDALYRQLDISKSCRYPSTSLWSKLFKKEVLSGLRLPDGRIHEEYAFLSQAFCRCPKYVYVNETLYKRTLRKDSTTAEVFSGRTLDKLEVFRQRNEFLAGQDDRELYELSKAWEYDLMLHYYGMSVQNNMKEQANKLKLEMLAEKEHIRDSRLKRKKKQQYDLFFTSPAIYILFRRLKGLIKGNDIFYSQEKNRQ